MKALDIAVALVVLTALVGAGWAARGLYRTVREPDYRTRNDRAAAQRITRLQPRPEPGQPGTDDRLLDACRAICPDLTRREKP